MSKLKFDVSVIYSGIFTKWDVESNALPRLLKSTVHIPAEIDIEFGFIAHIKKAKNQKLRYCIYHPDVPDENDIIRPPFDGELYVESNDWKFFIGDTIWAPLHNKVGNWRMTLELKGRVIAEKTFKIHLPDDLPFTEKYNTTQDEQKIAAFWKKRGL